MDYINSYLSGFISTGGSYDNEDDGSESTGSEQQSKSSSEASPAPDSIGESELDSITAESARTGFEGTFNSPQEAKVHFSKISTREGCPDDATKMRMKSKRYHLIGKYRSQPSSYHIFCREKGCSCKAMIYRNADTDFFCFGDTTCSEHSCMSVVKERGILGCKPMIELSELKEKGQDIRRYFVSKVEVSRKMVHVSDVLPELKRDVLKIDDLTKLVTRPALDYLHRVLLSVREMERRKTAYPFRQFLQDKYPDHYREKIEVHGDNMKLVGIAWMRPQQVINAGLYSDVLSIDTTAHKNEVYWPVVLITGRDRENNVVVLFQAIIVYETKDVFAWIMEQYRILAGLSSTWVPETMFSDDDVAIFNAVTEWSKGETLALCDDWHHNCNMKTRLARSKTAKTVDFKTLTDCFFSCKQRHSEAGFQESWRAFQDIVADDDLELRRYLTETLYPRRERWAKAFRMGYLTIGKCGDQDVESCNAYLRKKGCCTSSSPAKIDETLALFDQSVVYKQACNDIQRRVVYSSIDGNNCFASILNHVGQYSSLFATKKVNEYISQSFNYTTDFLKEEDGSVHFQVCEDVTKMSSALCSKPYTVVFGTNMVPSCQCETYGAFGLLCPHVVAVIGQDKHWNFPVHYSMLHPRWRNGSPVEDPSPSSVYHDAKFSK